MKSEKEIKKKINELEEKIKEYSKRFGPSELDWLLSSVETLKWVLGEENKMKRDV